MMTHSSHRAGAGAEVQTAPAILYTSFVVVTFTAANASYCLIRRPLGW